METSSEAQSEAVETRVILRLLNLLGGERCEHCVAMAVVLGAVLAVAGYGEHRVVERDKLVERDGLIYEIDVDGAERVRTADPHVANVVLSQLSYCPVNGPRPGRRPPINQSSFSLRAVSVRARMNSSMWSSKIIRRTR